MQTFTSYFAKSGKLSNAVCIALYPPRWFPGIPVLKELAPTKQILSKWNAAKKDPSLVYTEEMYSADYHAEVLSKLDPKFIYATIEGKILCCYEKPGEFCHRHLVAKWLNDHVGVTITEL